MTKSHSTWKAALGTALAIVLFAGAYAGLAHAAQGPGGPGRSGMHMMGPGPGAMFGMLGRELGLTDAQRQQIRTIAQQHRSEIQPLAKTAHDAREALMDAARNGADDGVLQQKATDLGNAESQLALSTAKVQALIFQQVLTPDQQKKALQLRDEMKTRMEQRMQRRQQKQPGGGSL